MAARSPSKPGLTLALCLLIGLLAWRFAVAKAAPWLDLAVLVAAAPLLLAISTFLQKTR